ncbi:hypothetical protein CLU79DRAFT_841455 [Phycomyces nitens]|nr:hypothetical protein CLU79DRAFT_841455 [Phycomyces nitens]
MFDFFGKVVLFFEHVFGGKRWPLALVLVYPVHVTNGIPIVSNVEGKIKVVHLSVVKELVGLVVSEPTHNTITTSVTKYVVWPELNRGSKLVLVHAANDVSIENRDDDNEISVENDDGASDDEDVVELELEELDAEAPFEAPGMPENPVHKFIAIFTSFYIPLRGQQGFHCLDRVHQ